MKEGIDWLYANVEEAYADAVTFGNAEKLLAVQCKWVDEGQKE